MPTLTLFRNNVILGLAVLLGLVLAGIALVVWLLPAIIQSQLPAILSEKTGKPVTVNKVGIGYKPFSIRVKGFAIQEQTGQPMVAFDGLYLELDLLASIDRRTLIVTQLVLDKPLLHLARNPQGTLNAAELMGKFGQPAEQDGEPFPVLIRRLEWHEGKLSYADAIHPHLNTTLYPLNADLSEFSPHLDKPGTVNLSFNLDTGAQITGAGTLGISPFHSAGKLKLAQVDLKKNLAFANIDNWLGTAHAEIDYLADYDKGNLKLAIGHAKLDASGLAYKQQGRSLAIDQLNQEARLTLNYQDGKLDLAVSNAKLRSKKVRYQQPNLSVNVDALAAETELTLKQEQGNLGITTGNSRLHVNDVSYREPDIAVNLARLEHETQLDLKQGQGQLQLTATKAILNGQGLDMTSPLWAKAKNFAIDSPYRVSHANNTANLVIDNGSLIAKGLHVPEKDQAKPILDAGSVRVDAIHFNLLKRQLNIGSINVDNASGKAELNPDGSLNYQKLLGNGQAAKNARGDRPAAEKKTWQIVAESIGLHNSAVSFTDHSLTPPQTVSFKPIGLTLTGYASHKTKPLPVQLNVGVNGGGSAKINGTLTPSPLSANLDVDLKNIDLEKFKGYFSRFIRLNLVDGRANLNGQLKLTAQEPLDLTFTGNLTVADFLTRDQRVFKDFIKWKNLALRGIGLYTLRNHYTAQSLNIVKPYAKVSIRKDKSSNFDDLLIGQANPDKKPGSNPSQKPAPVSFKLDSIKVTGGSSDFTDFSLILPFSAYIEDLQGGAAGVSSEKDSIIKITLTGDAFDLAPVRIDGNLSPFLGDYAVQMNFVGLPMPLVSPYMVQFAGYKVEKGKLSLRLNYKVANKKLAANNSLLIDQFELGEEVENPDAVNLPLKLAVALLKDSDGRIRFDFPISGSLENPKFNLADLIKEALTNAISRIVAAPFAIVGALIKTDEDLSTISFSPGNFELAQTERTKLNKIASVLSGRPAINIGIKGMAYQQQDWSAISDEALFDQLKQRRANEINQNAEVKIRAEYVSLSSEEYKRLLAELFIEKFPHLAEKSLFGTPRLKAGQTGDFFEVAKEKLMKTIRPEHQRLKELAIARAKAITKYLMQYGKISQEKIYILDPSVDPEKNHREIASLLFLKAD